MDLSLFVHFMRPEVRSRRLPHIFDFSFFVYNSQPRQSNTSQLPHINTTVSSPPCTTSQQYQLPSHHWYYTIFDQRDDIKTTISQHTKRCQSIDRHHCSTATHIYSVDFSAFLLSYTDVEGRLDNRLNPNIRSTPRPC